MSNDKLLSIADIKPSIEQKPVYDWLGSKAVSMEKLKSSSKLKMKDSQGPGKEFNYGKQVLNTCGLGRPLAAKKYGIIPLSANRSLTQREPIWNRRR